MDLRGRSLVKPTDLTRDEFLYLVELASRCRREKRMGFRRHRLAGRSIALIFEKTSTRTRSAFEVAAHDEGGHVTYLGPGDCQLGRNESVRDSARVLGRMFDGIEYRGYSQDDAETLARESGVPVWNGLTDLWHPTQMLADVLTMRDHTLTPLADVTCCYLGDGRNNTANSLLVTGALLGLDVRICAPKGLWPSDYVQGIARDLASQSGVSLTITDIVSDAIRGADYLYTDAWVSVGEPQEVWAERINLLQPYKITGQVMTATRNPAVKFLHCLPAMHNLETEVAERVHARYGLRSLEVTEEVFESPASVVFDQAENRLHTIKATMVATIAEPAERPQAEFA